MQKVDPNSQEFKEAFKKTEVFVQKVVDNFGFAFNPDSEIVESVKQGLTRNKIIYKKFYCPCFFVTQTSEDRICPCKPAINDEIPNGGSCHCGIFCTPEYAKEEALVESADEIIHSHTREPTKEEMEAILHKDQLSGEELGALLEARDKNMVDFVLVDVREWMEYVSARIDGTDELVPTTAFYNSLDKLEKHKDKKLILYCHVGSRSAYCQRAIKDMGYNVGNLTYGIISYEGKIARGE